MPFLPLRIKKHRSSPGQAAQLVRASPCMPPRGGYFGSWLGHLPGLRALSLVGTRGVGRGQVGVSLLHRCFSLPLSPPFLAKVREHVLGRQMKGGKHRPSLSRDGSLPCSTGEGVLRRQIITKGQQHL